MEDWKEALDAHRIIAIIRGVEERYMGSLFQALYDGGIRFAEVTLNTEGALTVIPAMQEQFGDRMMVGAGTVLNLQNAKDACEAGARFLVTPNTDPEVIRWSTAQGIPIFPGAMTPSEIVTAYEAGARYIKIFPASSLGPAYVKDLKGPLNHINFLPVGGITVENIPEFLEAGASGFGIGGSLCSLPLIRAGRFDEITALAERFVKAATV